MTKRSLIYWHHVTPMFETRSKSLARSKRFSKVLKLLEEVFRMRPSPGNPWFESASSLPWLSWGLQTEQLCSQHRRKCTQTLLVSRGIFFKMVRVCAYPGCFNQEKSVRLRQWASVQEESLTFHTLPLHDPERLKLWLIALHRETESPIQSIRGLRVCSQHFPPSDFSVAKGNKRRLNSTSVPKLFVQQRTEVGVEYNCTIITWFPMDMIRISEGSTYVKGKKKSYRDETGGSIPVSGGAVLIISSSTAMHLVCGPK